jgi:hypothetical protein
MLRPSIVLEANGRKVSHLEVIHSGKTASSIAKINQPLTKVVYLNVGHSGVRVLAFRASL